MLITRYGLFSLAYLFIMTFASIPTYAQIRVKLRGEILDVPTDIARKMGSIMAVIDDLGGLDEYLKRAMEPLPLHGGVDEFKQLVDIFRQLKNKYKQDITYINDKLIQDYAEKYLKDVTEDRLIALAILAETLQVKAIVNAAVKLWVKKSNYESADFEKYPGIVKLKPYLEYYAPPPIKVNLQDKDVVTVPSDIVMKIGIFKDMLDDVGGLDEFLKLQKPLPLNFGGKDEFEQLISILKASKQEHKKDNVAEIEDKLIQESAENFLKKVPVQKLLDLAILANFLRVGSILNAAVKLWVEKNNYAMNDFEKWKKKYPAIEPLEPYLKYYAASKDTFFQHLPRLDKGTGERKIIPLGQDPQRLAQYKSRSLGELLGGGSYGKVYKLKHGTGAVKQFKEGITFSHPQIKDMATKMAFFSLHQSFLDFHGAKYTEAKGDEIGHVSLLMEEGGKTLDKFFIIDKTSLSEEELNQVTIDLLEGMNFMHKNHYLHLDIKPQNMMIIDGAIGKRGVIIDTDDATSLVNPPEHFGISRPPMTLAYAPVEQYMWLPTFKAPLNAETLNYNKDYIKQNRLADLSDTTDNWALGISLFEITTKTPMRKYFKKFKAETGTQAVEDPGDWFRRDNAFKNYLLGEINNGRIGANENERGKLKVFLNMIDLKPQNRLTASDAANQIRKIYNYPIDWGISPRMPTNLHPYTKALLTQEVLRPKRKVQIGNQTFYLSHILELQTPTIIPQELSDQLNIKRGEEWSDELAEKGYNFMVMYSLNKDLGLIVPVLLYRSRSSGEWRSTPGLTDNGTISKGMGFHYAQETKPVYELLLAIDVMENARMIRQTNLAVPELFPINLRVEFGLNDYIPPYFNTQVILSTPLSGFKGVAGSGTQKFVKEKGDKIVQFIENIELIGPDFTKQPIEIYTTKHTLLGDIIVEVFEEKFKDGKIKWHMARDGKNRVWIDRISFSPPESLRVGERNLGEVNNFGTAKYLIDSGVLTYKPLDYKSQLDPDGSLLRKRIFDNFDDEYLDVTPVLAKLKAIQNFKKMLSRRTK